MKTVSTLKAEKSAKSPVSVSAMGGDLGDLIGDEKDLTAEIVKLLAKLRTLAAKDAYMITFTRSLKDAPGCRAVMFGLPAEPRFNYEGWFKNNLAPIGKRLRVGDLVVSVKRSRGAITVAYGYYQDMGAN